MLAPLVDTAARELVEALLGRPPGEVVDAVGRAGEGNPSSWRSSRAIFW